MTQAGEAAPQTENSRNVPSAPGVTIAMMTTVTRRTFGRLGIVAVLTALLPTGGPVEAHQPFSIEGTIVTFDEYRVLVVRTPEGESFRLQLQESTTVRREKERVPQTELRPGRRVDVRIMADSLYDDNPFVLSVQLADGAGAA